MVLLACLALLAAAAVATTPVYPNGAFVVLHSYVKFDVWFCLFCFCLHESDLTSQRRVFRDLHRLCDAAVDVPH